jgi:hypothetical protein
MAPNEKAKAGAQHEDFQMSTDPDARLAFEPLVRPRDLEPHFSFWMNELTERNLHDKADIAIELARLSKERAALAGALAGACSRMDRARAILTDNNPRPECNWGMLNTSDLRPNCC